MSARRTMTSLLLAISTAIGASLVLFVLIAAGPDPLASMAADTGMDRADLERLAHSTGLDRPFWSQYASWLTGLMRGDLGLSIRTNGPAASLIGDHLLPTVLLVLSSLALALAIAVPLGTWSAARAHGRADVVVGISSSLVVALPSFFVALLLQLAAVQLKDIAGEPVLHVSGGPRSGTIGDVLGHYLLPVLTLALVQVAGWVRYSRASVLDALGSEFVAAAEAKGLPGRTVLLRHAVRAALPPLVTLAALDLGTIIGGAVIVESAFGLPGTGRLLLDAVQAHDTVVALDIIVLAAAFVAIGNALADIINARLDPRMREAA